MARVEVHKFNRAFMVRFGIHSYNLTDSTNEFYKSFPPYFFLSTVVFLNFFSSGAFVYMNWPNLEIILEPFLILVCGLQYGGMLLSVGLNMRKVKLLHLTLQQIVDEAKEDTVYNIYCNVEMRCRKYTKIMGLGCIWLTQSMVCITFISSIYNIIIGNLDTSTWELPFSLLAPFNTETILGWYMLFSLNFCIAISYAICVSTTTSYYVSGCLYVRAIYDHFNALMDSIKDDCQPKDGTKRSQPIKLTKKMHKSFEKKLHNAVEIHVKIYEVFNLLADINSGSIFALLPPNILLIACTLFNSENTTAEAPVMIAFHVVCVVCSLTVPFLFCYYADFVTDQIADISQAAYDSNWLDWPPEMQKNIILIIARSQEPIYFTGLGLFACTLEVLGKIINSSFSYYLIFRNFSQN